MALGSPGVAPLEMEALKERALKIVRSSRDPARCLLLMRAKAASFFQSGGLGAACKEFCVEKGQVSVSSPLSPLAIDQEPMDDLSEVPQIEIKVFSDDVCRDGNDQKSTIGLSQIEDKIISVDICRLDSMESKSGSAAVELINLHTQSDVKTMVVIFGGSAATKHMAAKFCFGCDEKNLVMTLLGDNVLSIGVPLLRVDDEPPDPGDSRLQMQDYDKDSLLVGNKDIVRGKKSTAVRKIFLEEDENSVSGSVRLYAHSMVVPSRSASWAHEEVESSFEIMPGPKRLRFEEVSTANNTNMSGSHGEARHEQ